MWYSAVGFVVTLTLSLLVAPRTAEAQQATNVHRIGRLGAWPSHPMPNPSLEAFRQGLRDLGYVEGQNLVMEYRYAEGKAERLPDLAAELVRLQVDVLVARSAPRDPRGPARDQHDPDRLAPPVNDPVEQGIVASLARPGGNVTGVQHALPQRSAEKRLELFKEAMPGISTGGGALECGAIPAWPCNSVRDAGRCPGVGAGARTRWRRAAPTTSTAPWPWPARNASRGSSCCLASLCGTPCRSWTSRRRTGSRRYYAERTHVQAGRPHELWAELSSDVSGGRPSMWTSILKGAKPADLPVEDAHAVRVDDQPEDRPGARTSPFPPSLLFQADEVIK